MINSMYKRGAEFPICAYVRIMKTMFPNISIRARATRITKLIVLANVASTSTSSLKSSFTELITAERIYSEQHVL